MTKNDITGDEIKSKITSQQYRDNWDKIFKSNVGDYDKSNIEELLVTTSVGYELTESLNQAILDTNCTKTYVLSEEEYQMYQWYEYLAHNVDSALGPASDDVLDMMYQDFYKETWLDPKGEFIND